MGKEIERKFLVKDDSFAAIATKMHVIRQGYLSTGGSATVRLRIIDDQARITVKSRVRGLTRGEWEYAIPKPDAEEMLGLCSGIIIEKRRYIVPYHGYIWEVDVFEGHHAGLFIAEIELPDENAQFDLPPFVGKEVSSDARYYNSNLARLT